MEKENTNTVVFLEGKRLYLRPIEESDMGRCARWINNPGVRGFLGINQYPSDMVRQREWHRQRDRGCPPKGVTLAIVLKDGHRHIGNIGLDSIDWLNRHGRTGCLIGEKDCWGQGYGYEAKELLLEYGFNTLNLNRISSRVKASNPRSLAYLKKSGYLEEGRCRQEFFENGQWVDAIILGVLAEDWRAARKG